MASYVSRVVGAYPVRLAFVGSLLLSFIAVLGVSTVGRDAALYLDLARQVGESGPSVAFQSFDWPWFVMLLAGTHAVTSLPLEWCAYLWCALFMAGTCALLVDCVRQRVPAAAGWACLLVLAMPAVNQLRNDIIREFGFWLFCVLALWLTLRWQARGGWVQAACIHVAIIAAALFRLEAVMLFAALGLWQLTQLRSRENWPRFFQFVALPALGLVVVVVALLVKGGLSSARVAYYVGMLDPRRVLEAFHSLANQFGDSLRSEHSRDEAGRIVFFGVFAALAIKFISLAGPFSLPFLRRESWQAVGIWLREYRPFAWVAALYVVILMLFFVFQQFLNGRYISFLNLLVVPMLAVGGMLFAQHFPRLGKGLVVVGLLVMLSNVISTSAGKTQYVDAGRWIAANLDAQAKVYYEDGRISYYAGRGYPGLIPREQALTDSTIPYYGYFVLEERADSPWLIEWTNRHQLRVLASFQNRKKATVVVIGR